MLSFAKLLSIVAWLRRHAGGGEVGDNVNNGKGLRCLADTCAFATDAIISRRYDIGIGHIASTQFILPHPMILHCVV
jgi:hypothetical protein